MNNNMIGHNRPSFDDVVEENLRRGLLLMQRDALIRAIEDPRLQPRHRLVLAKIIKRTNQKTATSYPGRKTISQDTGTLAGGVPDPDGGYSEQVIANTISELIAYGYLVHDRRAPDTGGRALSHYALAAPSVEDVELEVQSYLQAIEARAPRIRPNVTIRSDVRIANVTIRSDVTTGGYVRSQAVEKKEEIPDVTTGSDVTTGGDVRVADVTTGGGTVTSSKKDNIPPTIAVPPSPAPRKRDAKPRTRLPKDWTPSTETVAWARANFVATDQQILIEADKFRDHHASKGSTMADWPAAWRTWWGNGFHKIPRRLSAVRRSAPSGHQDTELADAFERARLADLEAPQCPT
jgi:hypothetical protein